MLFEKPRLDGVIASGPPSTLGEVWSAEWAAQRDVDNVNSRELLTEHAYDTRIGQVRDATGIDLVNPYRSNVGSVGMPGVEQDGGDPFAFFDAELQRLAKQFPDKAGVIRADRSPMVEAEERARGAERRSQDVLARSGGGVLPAATTFASRMGASFTDPVQLATLALGPWSRVGSGARAIVWNGIKAGAANAGAEAAMQPVVQSWRRDAGLDFGASQAALNIAVAGGLGFGLDAGGRALYRGVRGARGDVPVLDADGAVSGWQSKADALEAAAAKAARDSDLAKARDGDVDALRRLAQQTGAIDDPAVKGALDHAALNGDLDRAMREAGFDLDDGAGFEALAQSMRHADNPHANPPPLRPGEVPEPRHQSLADDAPLPAGTRRIEIDGKPVTFGEVDPLKIDTDAQTFQFKGGGDAAGATERLRGVERWDPIAAGRAVVYERADGSRIIADGHQRLSLARRLKDQQPMLQAFVFRERDGWTPGDIRALAAKKNLQEGSGTVVDAAAIIRERPDIIDKSVPLGSEAMRQARSLARLSDDAFGKVVAGVVPSNYAALIGDLVPDRSRHSGMLDELAEADPANVREARFVVHELLHTPVQIEEQMTLLGAWRVERSLMKERVGVLDKALGQLKADSRLFRTLDREAGRIEAAGNTLDKTLNAQRAAEAAEVAALIEQLAATRGPVGQWLNDAARAVAAGTLTKKGAADHFTRRVVDTLEREGLRGLLRDAEPPSPGVRIDEPNGPDAAAQVAELERSLAREIEAVRKPEAAADRDAVLFSLRRDDDDASSGRSMRSDVDALGFYSAALRAARAWPQTKGTPEQALMWLKKSGVKEGEIEATGLAAAIEGQKSVTRDEMIAHLEKNRVGLKEVVRGAPAISDYDKHALEVWGQPFNALNEDQQFSVRNYVDRGLNGFDGEASKTTKWSSYSLDPGNPSYRETVLHLPATDRLPTFEEWYSQTHVQDMPIGDPRRMQMLRDKYEREAKNMPAEGTFRSGHFPEPNITGHMMTSMVRDAEGRPVYLIDQIQSDWGQKLRDGGVRDEKKIAELKRRMEDARAASVAHMDSGAALIDGKIDTRNPTALSAMIATIRNKANGTPEKIADQAAEAWMGRHAKLQREFSLAKAEFDTANASVSGHPLVNTTDQWVNTTLRRALRQAAEADADRIAIPSGKTVESYNPQGDSEGNAVFYDQIVPKNLRNLLRKLDKQSPDPVRVDQLKTPTQGMKGDGFAVFEITPEVKRKIIAEGQPMFSMREAEPIAHTPRAMADWEEIGRALRDTVAMLPPDVRMRVEDKLVVAGRSDIDGFWHPRDRLVWVSLAADDPVRVARHEVVHALRQSGLLADAEFDLMYREAERLGLRAEYAIDRRYGDAYRKAYGDKGDAFVEALLREEVIAEMFGEARIGRRFGGDGAVDRIVEAVLRFLERMRNALDGLGFRDVRDVFEAIERGTVARRDVYAVAQHGDGTLFAFGGERARTADLDALKRARAMDDERKPRDDIWRETGWFRGVDGKWRFEIDDSGMRLNAEVTKGGYLKAATSTFGDGQIIFHPDVLSAYPELARMPVRVENNKYTGSYFWPGAQPEKSAVVIGDYATYRREWSGGGALDDASVYQNTNGTYTFRSAAAHELQHAVQSVDGHLPPTGLGAKVRQTWPEVEARTVEKRMNLTADERRARPPWLDYDVPEDQQIVRFNAGDFSQSLEDADRTGELGELAEACKL